MKINKIFCILGWVWAFFAVKSVQAQPGWNVDPHQYMYSMTVTGKVFTDGAYSADVNDLVGAFINGECRGVANVKYVASVNDYFVFLMVYSNSPTDNITFRIFDKSKNMEYPAKESALFTVNGNSGTSLNPFIFTAANLNSGADILSFSIPSQVGTTSIAGKNITLQEHWSGNRKGITASFSLSPGARAYINGKEQISGVTVNDFDNTVQYSVKSEDNSVTAVYSVMISTANDVPADILLSNSILDENSGSVVIGDLTTVTANPAETHVYSLVDAVGTDNSYFKIEGSQLMTKASLNFEDKSLYKVNVKADDQKGGTVEKTFSITVRNINESPFYIQLYYLVTPSVAPAGFNLATLMAADPDNLDKHTFSLVSGNGTNDKDNARFYIQEDILKSKGELYFRRGDKYSLYVKAMDAGGLSVNISLVIETLENSQLSNESKLLSFGINNQVGQTVMDGLDVYVQQHWSYSLTSVVSSFSISEGAKAFINSVEQISGLSSNNYQNVVVLTVEAADKSTTDYKIHVSSVNDIPTDILLSNKQVEENSIIKLVGSLTTVTEITKDVHVYSIIDEPGTDPAAFNINGVNLFLNTSADYETKNAYIVKIRADDQKGGTVDKLFTISVINKNDPPINITLSDTIIQRESEVNSLIGYFSVEDQDLDDTHIWTLAKGDGSNDDGNELVKIIDNKLMLAQKITGVDKTNWNILVKVTDSKNVTYEKRLTITSPTINHPPVFNSTPVNYIVQNQVYAYALDVNDADGDSIAIKLENLPDWLEWSPELNLLSGSPDNDKVGIYNFKIMASDQKSSTEQKVSILVLDMNDAPEVNYYISNQTFITGKENLFTIPDDCIIDPDLGDKLNFSLSMSNNAALPEWLVFDPLNKTLKGTPPVGALGNYELKLTVTDQRLVKEWMIFTLNVSFPTLIPGLESSENPVLFPNPVVDELTINLPGSQKEWSISITDPQGKVIFQRKGSESIPKFYMGNLSSGIYFVSLKTSEYDYVRKIIKR